MDKINLAAELASNTYPGRGIIIGKHSNEKTAVVAYFIMGRSENSRNRVFSLDGDNMKTKAFDPAKLSDPSLIIYHPIRVLNDVTIVTNGDQTDTVYNALKAGNSFYSALRTRTFEPDPDNFTPRISGIINHRTCDYKLSILKSANNNPASTQRFFFEYSSPLAGEGHFIHTYNCDGTPIPSFSGEPKLLSIDGDIDTFTNAIWNSLNEDNKVSLFTRFISSETGKSETRIINKNI